MTQREWLVQVVVRADEDELGVLTQRVGDAICEPPDHDGSCATPWVLVSTPLDDLEESARRSWSRLLND